MKVYISGKISGMSPGRSMDKFNLAESKWRSLGYDAINPRRLLAEMPADTPYEEYIDLGVVMLKYCDAIYMLDNWTDSPGARVERAYAKALGLTVLYENRVDTEDD